MWRLREQRGAPATMRDRVLILVVVVMALLTAGLFLFAQMAMTGKLPSTDEPDARPDSSQRSVPSTGIRIVEEEQIEPGGGV
ncbi:MAG TPA: hypothetical protein VM534_05540, partial [Thermoanaerobaculia bacterium]|nr:hypothetical protein [Thermoanaerobaculia bacterium]